MVAEKSFRHSKIGKALLQSAFLFIFAVGSVAKADDFMDLIQQNEAAVAELGRDELIRLHNFRQAVEKDAFATTMKLCQGYRVSIGLPALPPGHEKAAYPVESSLAAWANILNEGFWVRISNEFGQKGYYNEKIASHDKHGNYDSWDVRSYYVSMYTLYLISSWGFVEAASHCLNTVNQRDIWYFADAIILADMAGTTVYDFAAFKVVGFGIKWIAKGAVGGAKYVGSFGMVKSFIAKSSRWVIRPASYAKELLTERVARFVPTKLIVGGIVIPVLADNTGRILYENEKEEKEGTDEITEFVTREPLSPEAYQRNLRYKTLERGFLLMEPVLQNQNDRAAQAKMTEFTSTEITPAKIELYEQDQKFLENIKEDDRTPEQINYLRLLAFMQPLFTAAQTQR